MGLLKNLKLLLGDSLLDRMLALERRQELLEDYTDQKLDSMKVYSLRVVKRDRDAAAKPERNERGAVNGVAPVVAENPQVARLLARRGSRGHIPTGG